MSKPEFCDACPPIDLQQLATDIHLLKNRVPAIEKMITAQLLKNAYQLSPAELACAEVYL